MPQIVVRYAPSPSGVQHMGSMRTLLFNWLFAKKNKGKLVLRIEDTDRDRHVADAVDQLKKAMQWLGLQADEGPYYQSQRLDIYQKYAQQLVREKKAYYCDCSIERLHALRDSQIKKKQLAKYDGYCRDRNLSHGSVIRLEVPQSGNCVFEDVVCGSMVIPNHTLHDVVIMRGNYPTYHFAVVVDDYEMHISHVIRGNDLLSSTPIHIHIWDSLGWRIPYYAHLPIIQDAKGRKISKRTGGIDVLSYQNKVLPDALINYLARLGWSYGNQEVFSREELINFFDLTHIQKHAARIDHSKMFWLNKVHMMRQKDALPKNTFLEASMFSTEVCTALREIYVSRVDTLGELMRKEIGAIDRWVYRVDIGEMADKLCAQFEHIPWEVSEIKKAIQESMAGMSKERVQKIFRKLNIIILGTHPAPDLYQMCYTLGRRYVCYFLGRKILSMKNYMRSLFPGISKTQMNKFFYYAQAYFLVRYQSPLIYTSLSAWKFGPVVPILKYLPKTVDGVEKLTLQERQIIEEVVHKYGHLSASALRDQTHREDPWRDAWGRGQGTQITNQSLFDFFSKYG